MIVIKRLLVSEACRPLSLPDPEGVFRACASHVREHPHVGPIPGRLQFSPHGDVHAVELEPFGGVTPTLSVW